MEAGQEGTETVSVPVDVYLKTKQLYMLPDTPFKESVMRFKYIFAGRYTCPSTEFIIKIEMFVDGKCILSLPLVRTIYEPTGEETDA